MKLCNLLVIAALVGAVSVLGCGDDGGGSGGTTGTGGSGGTPNPTELCNEELCATDAQRRAACETGVQTCIDTVPEINWDECILGVVGASCNAD